MNPDKCAGPPRGGDFTPEQCRAVRDEWRRHHPAVVKLWAGVETVTRITPVPAGKADTLLTGRQYRPATEGK